MPSPVAVRRFVAQPSRIRQFDHFAELIELLLRLCDGERELLLKFSLLEMISIRAWVSFICIG
jgi:hypothetical protein